MSPKRYTVRDGKSVEVGSVFKAWGSGDLNKMLAALSDEAHLIDRHFLLQNIVDITYKSRNEESSRGKCKDIAETHISEFPSIAEALKKDMGTLPRITTFQHYATILTEDGDFAKAIEVCTIALKYGLHDGTKSGFEGRIKRIEKKAAQS